MGFFGFQGPCDGCGLSRYLERDKGSMDHCCSMCLRLRRLIAEEQGAFDRLNSGDTVGG